MRGFGVMLSILAHSLVLLLMGHVWVLDQHELLEQRFVVFDVQVVAPPPEPVQGPDITEPEPVEPGIQDPDPADKPPPPEALAPEPPQDMDETPPQDVAEAETTEPPQAPPPASSPPPSGPVSRTPGQAAPSQYQEYFDTLFAPIDIEQVHQEDVTAIDPDRARPVYQPDETQPAVDDVYFGRNTLKQGNEIRLSLRALADYDFQQEDFIGLYSIGPRRTLNILDGRAEYGALLIHDSKTGLFRDLHKNGKYIYTYGPAFGDAEPVVGTILFLPQIREKEVALQKPSRLSWTPEDPPMEMAVRSDVVEEPLQTGNGDGILIRPWGKTGLPCLVLVDDTGRRTMLTTLARFLAARDIAVFLPSERDPSRALRDQAWSILALVRELKRSPHLDSSMLGVWGIGRSGLAAMKCAAMGSDVALAIASPQPGQAEDDHIRQLVELAGNIYSTVLWLPVSSRPERDWADLERAAEELRREGRHLHMASLASFAELAPAPDHEGDEEWLEELLPFYLQQVQGIIQERSAALGRD